MSTTLKERHRWTSQDRLVTVCLPNRNNRRFLEPRIASIRAQTHAHWELVAIDGESSDGAWEYLNSIKRGDPRIQVHSQPPRGPYAAINECLRRARGDFVYIATSDDTMKPTCLEKLLDALDRRPECGFAHCCLTFVNTAGQPLLGRWEEHATSKFLGQRLQYEHARKAPHDAVLQLALGATVYYSLTQLLIRRDLIERVGYFRTDFGAEADFEWELRLSAVADVVHVPLYLATWRIHEDQATSKRLSAGYWARILDMAECGFTSFGLPHRQVLDRIGRRRLLYTCRWFWLQHALFESTSLNSRLRLLWEAGRKDPSLVWDYLARRTGRRGPFDRMTHAAGLLQMLA